MVKNSNKNILMVGPSVKSKGGVSTAINNYFNSSLIEKFNITYIATLGNGKQLSKLAYALSSYIKTLYYLSFTKVDMVHIHIGAYASFYRKSVIVLLSRLFKKKIILHVHDGNFSTFYHVGDNKIKKNYISYILNSASTIIALSYEWESKLSEFCKVNIQVLYNSVFVPPKNLYSTSAYYITYLGDIIEAKGVFDLLEIVPEVLLNKTELEFLFCGNGEIEKANKIIKDLGVKANVKMLGWIDGEQKKEILKNTMIFVLPSYAEGMPMSVLEAMSYGIPVVTSRVGGIPTVIDHEVNGFMINPGDKVKLKENINKLILDIELRQNISSQAYSDVKDKFDIHKNIENLTSIYMLTLNAEKIEKLR